MIINFHSMHFLDLNIMILSHLGLLRHFMMISSDSDRMLRVFMINLRENN